LLSRPAHTIMPGMNTADEIINELGGRQEVSYQVGISASAVDNWRYRGIPPRYWPQLIRLARQLGRRDINLDSLEVHRPIRHRRKYVMRSIAPG
jgi:hypothetical protein